MNEQLNIKLNLNNNQTVTLQFVQEDNQWVCRLDTEGINNLVGVSLEDSNENA